MRNKICNERFVHPDVYLFILLVVVFVWFKAAAAATSLGLHQLVAAAEGGNNKCMDKERKALLHFKFHIQLDPLGRLSTWAADEDEEDCCKWTGVKCNNRNQVIHLDLFNGVLGGKISPSLLNLTFLNHLDLRGNHFNGIIPSFIGSMTQLNYLDLALNQFDGNIPLFIGSMTQLRHLDLSGNFLNGTIPPELGNLTNLQYLSLRNLVGCTVENLDWLSHLSQLEYLSVSGTSLANANRWVNVISSLPKLSALLLQGCELSQVMHPYSSSVNNFSSSSIVSLNLNENNLNSSMYHWLIPLTSNTLEVLSLSYNKLDGIPKYLGKLCNLTDLNLYNNSIAVKFPELLTNLSGCTSNSLQLLFASQNRLTGSLSDEIQMFSSLEYLYLDDNHLNGTISEKVWELPKLGILDLSSNSLRGSISDKIGKSKLWSVNLSNNSLETFPLRSHMSNLSYIHNIDLSSCKLGPHFPKWIQTLTNLTYLNIANTRISDTIPLEFWSMWPSQLRYLNLSSNNITGEVPDLLSNFGQNSSLIDLSSNNFYGHIPNVPSTLVSLDLSKNKFLGGISFLCQISSELSFLDLSNNSLTGQIPDCLWHFKELKVLNLGDNNLSGRLPTSFKSLINLEVLYLFNNSFSGELPLSLKNCTKLNFLDLGDNKFSGSIPTWIGEQLSGLYVLSLTSNNFFGTITLHLCKLRNLQILDLSKNNLYGTIPSCVNNLTNMAQNGFSPNQKAHYYSRDNPFKHYLYSNEYVDHLMIKWQGSVREFRSTLGLVKIIDLSSNNLTGQIPDELANLSLLVALNLSNNALHGKIPTKIGQMKNLLTLDLSRNNLSGGIPSSMSQMTSLNYLDVSNNNLSGRIPSGTQLQSFDPSRYTGNAGLCGPPVTKTCPGDEDFEVPHGGEIEDDEEGDDELERWFYIGGATGFTIGFWIVCSALLLNRHGRHAFFRFMDSLENWVYVKVVLFIAKLQRFIST